MASGDVFMKSLSKASQKELGWLGGDGMKIPENTKLEDLKVAGAGVAGSYLHALVKQKYDLDMKIYDPSHRRGCGCAWGCFYTLLHDKLGKVGLNVNDYVLCKNEGIYLNGEWISIRNQISIDKPKLLADLCPEVYITKQKYVVDPTNVSPFINATGIPTATASYIIETEQYRIKLRKGVLQPAINYIYMEPSYTGYAWAFSLDDSGETFHIGAGCGNASPDILIRKLCKFYGIYATDVKKFSCRCHRPIYVLPSWKRKAIDGAAINVGEAAGVVFPITGEGIIPAMDSVDILVDSLDDNNWRELYEQRMQKYFEEYKYDEALKIWKYIIEKPRRAWIKGAGIMVKRASERAQPEISATKAIVIALQMALGLY